MALVVIMFFGGCKSKDTTTGNNSLSTQDKTFMAAAKEANLAEIDAGQMASTKGNNASVISFGQYMVSEHNTALTSLDSLLNVVGYSVGDTLSAMHQQLKQTLAGLSGHAFDTTYIGAQVKDHQTVIQLFQTEIQNGQYDAVKGYANRFLPHIQMHYNLADSIRRTL